MKILNAIALKVVGVQLSNYTYQLLKRHKNNGMAIHTKPGKITECTIMIENMKNRFISGRQKMAQYEKDNHKTKEKLPYL